jgi:hypothetical protein
LQHPDLHADRLIVQSGCFHRTAVSVVIGSLAIPISQDLLSAQVVEASLAPVSGE